ncbi:hypothetical protein L1887_37783 [Cichorium endivia]|nr:hypothetical protein L1887_37783 [Cichorium endivia]
MANTGGGRDGISWKSIRQQSLSLVYERLPEWSQIRRSITAIIPLLHHKGRRRRVVDGGDDFRLLVVRLWGRGLSTHESPMLDLNTHGSVVAKLLDEAIVDSLSSSMFQLIGWCPFEIEFADMACDFEPEFVESEFADVAHLGVWNTT